MQLDPRTGCRSLVITNYLSPSPPPFFHFPSWEFAECEPQNNPEEKCASNDCDANEGKDAIGIGVILV